MVDCDWLIYQKKKYYEKNIVVDGDGRIQSANKLGRETVSKDMDHITGYLGGEVFQCHYATLPGGCGQTLHCKSCVIRKGNRSALPGVYPARWESVMRMIV